MLNDRHRTGNCLLFMVFLFALVAGTLAGCSKSGEQAAGGLNMASLHDMPASVQAAPVSVQQAYQFAAANPDLIKQLPCYCGCGAMGHTSNYACYVSETGANGQLTYDEHALGCSICVDITQDAMRLLKDGKTVSEIRSYVDTTYAKYGPSNIP